jgi:acyl-CoA hydrolase
LLDHSRYDYDLFAPPNPSLSTVDHAIGLHASSLVRDGGTLQIGIGTLSDALVYALRLRHQGNADYRAALAALRHPDAGPNHSNGSESIGSLTPFVRGLYGASEMVMDGFMHLARAGILSRRVYDDMTIEKALAGGEDPDLADRTDGRYLRGAFTSARRNSMRGCAGWKRRGLRWFVDDARVRHQPVVWRTRIARRAAAPPHDFSISA